MAQDQLQEFQKLKANAAARLNSADQQQQDAITRRFASMGGMNKGAQIKLQNQAIDEGIRRKEDALGQIDIAEAGEAQRRKEFNEQVIGGRKFSAEEAQKARDHQGHLAQQDLNIRNSALQFEQGKKFDEMTRQFDTQMAMEHDAMAFNKGLAAEELKQQKRGLVGNVLGEGGMLGAVGGLMGTSSGGGIVGSVFGGGGGGSYFCTHMFKNGIVEKEELRDIQALAGICLFKKPEILWFYFMHAPLIIEESKKHGFDWTHEKDRFVTVPVGALKAGNKDLAIDAYTDGIKFMCLQFDETKKYWKNELLNVGLIGKVIAFVKLMRFKNMRRKVISKLIKGA